MDQPEYSSERRDNATQIRAALYQSKEALNNSSMNYQSKKKIKCDFIFFFIFNGLSATENGNTSMCCGNSELTRVSLNP